MGVLLKAFRRRRRRAGQFFTVQHGLENDVKGLAFLGIIFDANFGTFNVVVEMFAHVADPGHGEGLKKLGAIIGHGGFAVKRADTELDFDGCPVGVIFFQVFAHGFGHSVGWFVEELVGKAAFGRLFAGHFVHLFHVPNF